MAKKPRRTAREVLIELKWREGRDLRRAEIWYADRVKREGYKVIRGEEVTELGRGYFSMGDCARPYYKVIKVVCDGQILFERDEKTSKTAK